MGGKPGLKPPVAGALISEVMTTRQFIAMIGEAETGAIRDRAERLKAIGDGGLAGGFYQQHWVWRVDNWEPWMWEALQHFDADALESFIARHPAATARELADRYNLGHAAPDPSYDRRCEDGLARMGISAAELDSPVSD